MKFIRSLLLMICLFVTLAACGSTQVKITFETNTKETLEEVVIDKGTILQEPVLKEVEGFEFDGWYADAAFTKAFDFTQPVNKSLTIYAKWNQYYNIEFVTNSDETVEPLKVYKGETFELPNLEKDGYVLIGWYLDAEFENKYSAAPASKDLELYARWVAEGEKFDVNLYVQGEFREKVSVAFGQEIELPSYSKIGFVTGDWYYDEALTNPFDEEAVILEDINLYTAYVQDLYVLEVKTNALYVEFLSNKGDRTNEQTEFYDQSFKYMVGDDNEWKMAPTVELGRYDAESDSFEVVQSKWEYNLYLSVLENGNYKEANIADYVDEFDEVECTIDFSEAAIGKEFKVVFIPKHLTNFQLSESEIAAYTVTYECMVIDGFNAYTALELAYIENRADETDAHAIAWKEFKEEKGLDVNYHPANVILHANMNVVRDVLPDGLFYNEGDADLKPADSDYERTLGSIRDYVDIYRHNTLEGESFGIYGNYFNISTAQIPVVTRENHNISVEGSVISHSQLFYIEGAHDSKVSIENVSILGNAPRVEDKLKAGGLIFVKLFGPELDVKNVISSSFFISFMSENSKAQLLVENCKAYDSFNSFIYNWGNPNVIVKHCEFIGAGGPVLIQDHVHPTDEDGGDIAHTRFIDCNLESYVAGTEGWFSVVGATALVPQIKQLNAIFEAYGKSFLVTETGNDGVTFFNVMSVIKSGDSQSVTAQKVSGSVTFDSTTPFDYGASNPYLQAMLDQTYALGAPAFQGSNASAVTGFGYFNGSQVLDVQGNMLLPTDPLFSSEYLTIYYNGMAITVKLYDKGTVK